MKQIAMLVCLLTLSWGVMAQTQKADTTKAATEKPAAKADKKKKGKTYSDIITDEAESDEGLFHVHKVDDKYYFEIPNDLLEKEILVVSRIAGHVKGLNFGGAGMKSRPQQVVRFQKKDSCSTHRQNYCCCD